jgi:hypothetical protein
MLRPSKRLIYTPMSGRPYLSLWTRGRNSCYPSPLLACSRGAAHAPECIFSPVRNM